MLEFVASIMPKIGFLLVLKSSPLWSKISQNASILQHSVYFDLHFERF